MADANINDPRKEVRLDVRSLPEAGAYSVTVEEPPATGPFTETAALLETSELASPGRMLPAAIYPLGLSRRVWERIAALGFASLLALYFLWQVQAILPPFVIAFVLAAMLDPSVRYLESQGRSRVWAIFTLYLFGFCFVGLIIVFVIPLVLSQVQDLTFNFQTYSSSIQSGVDLFLHNHANLLKFAGIKHEHLHDIISHNPGKEKIAAALTTLTVVLEGMVSRVLWLIIIPVASFFFMRDYPLLRARIIALFPEPSQTQIDVMSRDIVDVFTAYLRGLAKICMLYAVCEVILLTLLGVKYALFLGIMAGLFYAVPYVGQLFIAVSVGAVAYLMDYPSLLLVIHPMPHSFGFTALVVVCVVVAHNVFDQIVYPRVVGASVGLHPVVSIFALMAGATLFNIWGMLIAVPVGASIQIVLMYFFPKLAQSPPPHLLEHRPASRSSPRG